MSLKSIKDHQPLLRARDGGVEPAGAVLGGPPETVVVDDHVLPLRPLGLVAGDDVAPDALDKSPHVTPIAAQALGVVGDVVVEMPLVEPLAAGNARPVLRPHRRAERERAFVADVRKVEEHAVDETEIVPVLEADDLLAEPTRVSVRKAGRLLQDRKSVG